MLKTSAKHLPLRIYRIASVSRQCVYWTDPTKPINDWKEAGEAAKKRAGASLMLSAETPKQTRRGILLESAALKCRFHDLRHTACTRLLEGDVPYPVVSPILGWSAATAIRKAKRYAHSVTKHCEMTWMCLDRKKLQ